MLSRSQRHSGRRLCFTAVISLMLAAPAMAEPFRDAASGLMVAPPAGYTTQQGPEHARYGVTVNVKKTEDKDTGCRVGFQPAPQNASLSQDEINKMAVTPEREAVIRQTLSMLYDVKTFAAFEHDGVRGVMVLGEFKASPNIPPRAAELQNILYLFETPKGRTNVVCVVEKTSYEQRRGEFEALARGVTVPR